MNNAARLCLIAIAFLGIIAISSAQTHLQPCHGQDTSHIYRTKTYAPVAIAISAGQKVAVAGHNYSAYGARGTVKVWNNLKKMMMGLNATDSLHLTEPGGVIYDNAGNLYVVQTERTDSNIMVYNASLHLIKVINNSPGTAYSWFNPRGIALDTLQNLYVISGDSIGTGGIDVPNTGKLIKITNPLSSAVKTVLLRNLNAPKAVAVKTGDLYISEYGNNEISRYNLGSMTKVDSVTVNKPMDLYTTGCRLYCTEHDSNALKIFDAHYFSGGVLRSINHLDTNRGPFGIALNEDQDLLICDSNRVLFYSDSESVTDTDYIATYASYGGPGIHVYPFCINHYFTLHDSARHGIWHTNDSSYISISADAIYDSIVHVFGDSVGVYHLTCTHGSITDTFVVGIGLADISSYTEVSDSVRGGTWFTRDTTLFALIPTRFDSAIRVFGYHIGGGEIYYRHGSNIDTFHVYADSTLVPDSIYTIGNSGNIYGSYRFCIGNIAELFDDVNNGNVHWSISDTTVAFIDESDGTVWPYSAGTAIVTYTVRSYCGTAFTTFTIIIDSEASAESITGPQMLCRGSSIVLKDTVLGGIWRNDNPSVATIATTGGDSINVYGVTNGIAAIVYYIDNTCADTMYREVDVKTLPNAGSITSGGTICESSTQTLTAIGADSSAGYWISNNPYALSIWGTSDTVASVHAYHAGSAVISYIDSNSCGADTTSVSYTVLALPDAGTVSGATSFCRSSGATYTTTGSGGAWYSSNSSVATISSAGAAIGLSAGTTYIYYKVTNSCGSDSSGMTLTILPRPTVGPIVGASPLCPGTSAAFYDSPSGGTWSTSSSTVATISASGLVLAISPGSTYIAYAVTNSCGTVTTFYSLTVNPLPNPGSLSGATSVCQGASITLTPSVSGGTWRASNTSATVSSAGVVTGLNSYADTIFYIVTNTCGRDSAMKIININPLPDTGTISVSHINCMGSASYATTTGASTSYSYWSSSNPSVATISSSGVITPISLGATVISYTATSAFCGSATATRVAFVLPLPYADTIWGPSSVCPGSTITLTDSSHVGLWYSSNSHATISLGTGVVTGVTAGVDTIYYIDSGYCGVASATHIITINPVANSGTITGPSLVCGGGSTVTLVDTTTGGTWSTAFGNATVTSSGVIHAVTAGTDTIKYTVTTVCGTSVTTHPMVVDFVPSAGTIYGPSSVCVGSAITFTDSVTGGTWHISNSHATMSATTITGVTAGLDTVSYTVTNVCGTATTTRVITVNAISVPSDSIIVTRDTVCSGDTVTFTSLPTNGGSAPTFQWFKFSSFVDTGVTFTYIPAMGDVITCKLTSNAVCPLPATVTSNSITMIVTPTVTPTISIVTSTGDSISYFGQLVTFYATVSYGGTATLYQWYEHGTAIPGATSSSFTTAVYSDDTVYCTIVSNAPCASSATATSNTINIYANYLGGLSINETYNGVKLFPNPNNGSFTLSGTIAGHAVRYEITDVTGKIVYSGIAACINGIINESIDLDGRLVSGAYFMKVVTQVGTIVLPFMKE